MSIEQIALARLLCRRGPPEVVEALVAAGANPTARTISDHTPLIFASLKGHTDIVAFLLQRNTYPNTALSLASSNGHQPIVHLLLDAGADPTIPAGPNSPLNWALSNNHHVITAQLRRTTAEADRARALHKARTLLGAEAAHTCLQDRIEEGRALPQVELKHHHQQEQEQQEQQQQQRRTRQQVYIYSMEKLRATAAFAAGVSGGEKDCGLCEELYVELLGYMLPAWADKGPQA